MSKGSPFPGMDPYAEQFWGHLHAQLVANATALLNDVLMPGLVAVSEQRVIIEDESVPERGMYPDVHVVAMPQPRPSPSAVGSAAAVAEPRVVEFQPASYKQSYIQIVDARSGQKVVTVIEFVSPSNKRGGEARRQYEQKQEEVSSSHANLVEVDLIRGRPPLTLAQKNHLTDSQSSPYHVSVRRGNRRERLEIYDIALRDPLPTIRVPLRPDNADVALNLQTLLSESYRRGRCADLIDYNAPLYPSLPPADDRWAAERVAAWRASAE